MSENCMIIDGNKIPLTDEQISQLREIFQDSNPNTNVDKNTIKLSFDRVNKNENYYCIDNSGDVNEFEEFRDDVDNELYSIANYCTDKDLIQQQAYRETLNRLLWRFTYQNGWDERLRNTCFVKYYICYDYRTDKWFCNDETYFRATNCIYFTSSEIAERAIEEIVKPFVKQHPDFKF